MNIFQQVFEDASRKNMVITKEVSSRSPSEHLLVKKTRTKKIVDQENKNINEDYKMNAKMKNTDKTINIKRENKPKTTEVPIIKEKNADNQTRQDKKIIKLEKIIKELRTELNKTHEQMKEREAYWEFRVLELQSQIE